MAVLGVLSKTECGEKGAIYIIIAHGLTSPAIFLLANINYTHTHTRNIIKRKGLSQTQPHITIFWFLVLASNIAAPPTLNLYREIIIITAIITTTFWAALPIRAITFLAAAYNLYIYRAQQGKNKQTTHTTHTNLTQLMLLTTPIYLLFLAAATTT